ncbi:Myc-type [Macleaya cordata]|uniref:Myc-type n=1 Tax=Macleaya cordata TaxID=56857 RepID=A0A200QA70_MACCD|nr:Myc-type [Macleaya cordata]
MENSTIRWLSEMGMDQDQAFIHQMNSFDEITAQQIAAALGGDQYHFRQSYFSADQTFSSYPPYMETTNSHQTTTITERPSKQLKTSSESWNSCTTTDHQHISTPPDSSSSPNNLLSFGGNHRNSPTNIPQQVYGNLVGSTTTVNLKEEVVSPGNTTYPSDVLISHQGSYMNKNYAPKGINQGYKRAASSTTTKTSYTQDHIMAERKRREKLSQRFIALSAIVPGLKKMDKASVLGDAIKYLKQLQEQVKTLEEQTAKKPVESVIFVRKTQLQADDNDSSSSDENSSVTGCSDEPLPEIEARVSDKNVLIRIHCEKRKGVLVNTLAEIEKLHLTILNSSVIPFAESALDITITAQTDAEYCMTVKDLVKNLRSAFRQFM